MVGQHKLQATIQRYIDTHTMPRTLLLEGDIGCGKHTLANSIAEQLGVVLIDITEQLTLETIERAMLSPTPYVYLIDSSKISVKEQNVILKFLEEPLKNAYIIVLCTNKAMLLNTVVNRCIVLTFEQYTVDELYTFVENREQWVDNQFKYANTPGRVKYFESINLNEMIAFAEKVLVQVKVANCSNILNISNSINFKNKPDLYDFDTFCFILLIKSLDLYTAQQIPYSIVEVTQQLYRDNQIPHINKQHMFEHYLIEMKLAYERS